jgi:hypothetical protein
MARPLDTIPDRSERRGRRRYGYLAGRELPSLAGRGHRVLALGHERGDVVARGLQPLLEAVGLRNVAHDLEHRLRARRGRLRLGAELTLLGVGLLGLRLGLLLGVSGVVGLRLGLLGIPLSLVRILVGLVDLLLELAELLVVLVELLARSAERGGDPASTPTRAPSSSASVVVSAAGEVSWVVAGGSVAVVVAAGAACRS